MAKLIEVVTDTASVAIFDPDALAGWKDGRDDWYSIDRERLAALRKGQLVVIRVPLDGRFLVRVTRGDLTAAERRLVAGESDAYWLEVTSGRVYCTALENVPGGGKPATASPEQVLK